MKKINWIGAYSLKSDVVTKHLKGEVTTEAMLKDLIETDQKSDNKIDMIKSINYFGCFHDILVRRFDTYVVDGVEWIDKNKANEHMVNPYHKTLVDQKAAYIAGNPISIKTANEQLKDILAEEVDNDEFADIMYDLFEGAAVKSYENLYTYIDQNGRFKYRIMPAETTIIIEDTANPNDIVQVIEYFTMEIVVNDDVILSKRVAVYDDEKITWYQEDENHEFFMIPAGHLGIVSNPEYHWYEWYGSESIAEIAENSYSDVEETGIQAHSFGAVPVVRLKNNSQMTNDLTPIKRYIDALDIVTSGFLNNLLDVQLMIWIIRGLGGEDLSEFMRNLINFKAVILEGTKDETDIDTKTMEIPIVARESLQKYLIEQIYEHGKGVDLKALTGGDLTNVAIKVNFANLDMKANKAIRKFKNAMKHFSTLLVTYLNSKYGTEFIPNELSYVIKKNLVFNETEIIDNIMKSRNFLSDDTLLEIHPFVDELDEEKDRLAKQQADNPIILSPEIDEDDDEDDEAEEDEE